VAGGIDEVELIHLPVTSRIVKRHTLGFNRNSTLALDVHGIQHLLVHLPGTESTAVLDKTVGQGRLAMIDMGDDGKISDVLEFTHSFGPGKRSSGDSEGAAAEKRAIVPESACGRYPCSGGNRYQS
jgi:hypothetical protein